MSYQRDVMDPWETQFYRLLYGCRPRIADKKGWLEFSQRAVEEEEKKTMAATFKPSRKGALIDYLPLKVTGPGGCDFPFPISSN